MLHHLSGKRIWICTLGCRSNQYEGEALANAFTEAEAVLSDTPDCDAAVLVTCTVTAVADKKCRQMIGRVRRASPDALIVACGCWAQNLPEEEAQALGIHLLVGNRKKEHVPFLVAGLLSAGSRHFSVCRDDVLRSTEWDSLFLAKPLLHTRAFVKVQDGCNHFCTYCAVPYARGFPVSRSPNDVLKEIRSIVSSGCREVVLTGVHLGLYGEYGEISLAELVGKVSLVEGLRRLRFGSIEPLGIDDELLVTLAGTSSFQPHLHIPLQSGSDRVLALMNRGYSTAEYRDIVRRVHAFLGDDVHVSTDVLVGFPGEDERAFDETLAFLEECRFGKVHVFPFSPRKGTKAFSLPERVPPQDIASRSKRALEAGERLLREYGARWIGREVSVLVESISLNERSIGDGREFHGLSPSFLRVTGREGHGAVHALAEGDQVVVRITGSHDDALKGCLVE